MTQNNLGIVLLTQGILADTEDGRILLRQSIEAFQSGLQVKTKEARPFEWKQTMSGLELAEKLLADLH